jgi:hypothetical protein
MGKLVKITANTPLKSDISAVDVVAASATIVDAELALWVGANVFSSLRYVEIENAVHKCLTVLRQRADGATITLGNVWQAGVDFTSGQADHLSNVAYAANVAESFSEDSVDILVGATFRNFPGSSVSTAVDAVLGSARSVTRSARKPPDGAP